MITQPKLFKRLLLLAVLAIPAILFMMLKIQPVSAANPQIIPFQGKVVNADGTNVTNGSYNFDFVLYDDAALGTPSDGVHDKWHELSKSVTVTNGVFQTNLGSATALPDFNANPSLYLAIRFNGDAAGYMTPRIQMGSVPYALNADNLGGLSKSGFVQLAQGVQTDTSTTNPSIFVNKANVSGSPNILELQKAGSDIFVIDNTGNITATGTYNGNTFNSSGALTFGNAGTATIQPASARALDITAHNSSTWSTDSGNLTIDATSGSTPTINLGTGGQAKTIQIGQSGTNAVTQTINIGNSGSGATTNISMGSSNAGTIALTGPTTITNRTTGSSDSFVVSNSTSTGSIAKFNDNSTTVLGIADGGAATFQNQADSQNAFQIKNASGLSLVNASTSAVAQLVQNNSIESNINGWVGEGTVTMVSSAAVTAQYGSRSLAVDTNAINEGANYRVPLVSGTQYSLSLWARQASGSANVLTIGYEDSADTDCLTTQTLSTTWIQYTCTFTPDANGATPNIYIKQSDATTRTIYIDGVSLIAGSSALTFDSGGGNINSEALTGNVSINSLNSGQLQPWQLNSTVPGAALRHASTAISNGYIYSIGGCTGACGSGTDVATVYYAKITASGAVSTWNTTTVIPDARYGHTSFTANGYLYVVGGDNGAGAQFATPQTTVYYAKLNGDGTVGTWQTSTQALPAARELHTTVFNGGFAYVIGGDNAGAQSTVYYAKVYADGSTGTWTTTTALTTGAAARRYASSVYANGFVYVIGGDSAGTTQSTVYYNSVNADGTLGASWASTTALTSGGAARRHHTSVVANGYVYVIGGDSGSAASNTVYFAKLNSDGSVSNWTANTNTLPQSRYGHISAALNGYIYTIGGYDGTTAQSTVFYASTPRILMGGTLDLVGLSSQYLSDPGGAGAIVAGNIRAIGGLQIEGFADINGGLSVDSVINLNAVGANLGQTVFNINNTNSNSIFKVVHMSTNFGAAAEAGAFIDYNSMYADEFFKDRAQVAADGNQNWGDNTEWNTAETGTCLWNGQPDTSALNGVTLITANAVASTCSLHHADLGAATPNTWVDPDNLPVVLTKVRASVNGAGVPDTDHQYFAGIADGAAGATPASGGPTNGIYFTNASDANGVTGTANWYGVTKNGAGTATVTACNVAVSETQFALLMIKVISTTTSGGSNLVKFYIDGDVSNGISFTECGSGNTTNVNVAGMTPYLKADWDANTNASLLEADFYRLWQDDAPISSAPQSSTSSEPPTDTPPSQGTPFETTESDTDSSSTMIDFLAATSEDSVFSNNIFVKGTLFADKIQANQIEGLEIFTEKLSSLEEKLQSQTTTVATNKNAGSPSATAQAFSSKSAVVPRLTSLKGLVVEEDAEFKGNAIFYKLVTFVEKTIFKNDISLEGHLTTNGAPASASALVSGASAAIDGNDISGQLTVAGIATSTKGEVARVTFSRGYVKSPKINLTPANAATASVHFYVDSDQSGFKVIIIDPPTDSSALKFNYLVVQ